MMVNTITREIDRCRHELEQALAALPDGDGDGMLPDALVPHAKEWYRLCERRFAVERITISGELAEAIVASIGRAAPPVAQERGQVDDAAVERACAEMWPTWKNHALRTDEDRERMRRCLAAAADGEMTR